MSRNALIYQEDPINSKMMTMFLEQSGYGVELAASFEDLKNKHTKGFAFVFIDIHNVAVSENELLDFVTRTKDYSCPPLIAILNNSSDKEIKRFLHLDMDGYITKPVSVKSLRDIISRIESGRAVLAPGDDSVDIDKLSVELNVSDKSMLIKLYDQFFSSGNNDFKSMYDAVSVKDHTTIRGCAHRLKNNARNMRLINISRIADEIEGQTKYPSASQNIEAMVAELESAFKRTESDYTSRFKKNA